MKNNDTMNWLPTENQKFQLLENKRGWNANSALLSRQSAGVLGSVKSPKWCRGSKLLKVFAIWTPALYCKILFWRQILNRSKVFLFNKLTYKSPSYVSTPDIHSFFLISTWLTTSVSPIRAPFYKRMSEKVNQPP